MNVQKSPLNGLCRLAMCAGVALCATFAQATTVQDLVRLKGHERNILTGMGIVIGLDGTAEPQTHNGEDPS